MALEAQQRAAADVETGVGAGAQPKGLVSVMPAYVRRGFIRKVYSILCVQLALTVAIGAAFVRYTTPAWVAKNIALFYVASFGSLAMVIGAACCCSEVVRRFPANYLFLFTLTVLESIVIGFVCTLYTGESVLIAVAATAFVFLCLTAYACLTKTDFTGCGPYLYAAVFALLGFSLIIALWSFFAPVPHGIRLVYACLGVLLFSFFIVYDTQLIVGGAHKHAFDIDDYCFAALNLYLDIINLFLFLLQIFGARN